MPGICKCCGTYGPEVWEATFVWPEFWQEPLCDCCRFWAKLAGVR